jgi:hypothetical protein
MTINKTREHLQTLRDTAVNMEKAAQLRSNSSFTEQCSRHYASRLYFIQMTINTQLSIIMNVILGVACAILFFT